MTDSCLAAPLVAGVLANFLTYDPIPFDTENADIVFVHKAKDYLKNTANWARKDDVKAIWNLVDEEHNPKKTDAASPETSTEEAPAIKTQWVSVPTPKPVAPYAQGTCHIHVKQWAMNGRNDGDYDLEVAMTDNDGNQIGYTERGGPYSDSDPLEFKSKLEDPLWCKPEDRNDYIAFAAGGQAWPSNGEFADGAVPSCSVGGWDGDSYRLNGEEVSVANSINIAGGRLNWDRNAKWIAASCVDGPEGHHPTARTEAYDIRRGASP